MSNEEKGKEYQYMGDMMRESEEIINNNITTTIKKNDSLKVLAEKMLEFVKICNRAWVPNMNKEQLNSTLFNISDSAAEILVVAHDTMKNGAVGENELAPNTEPTAPTNKP